ELMRWTEQLTHRIASEEIPEEPVPTSATPEPAAAPSTAPGPIASPARRRSWFAGSLANVESRLSAESSRRVRHEADVETEDTRVLLRNALDGVLENLGSEDLELVLDLARRLSGEQPPLR
ncbi:MAG TPA: hypothetical protein VFZ96_05900, partial [Actinomycetota bacterium]|nr:hypothetical protein [Actinomycetota bacterium]